MTYLTPSEIAELWGVSRQRVWKLCSEGRVKGAIKNRGGWLIPADAKQPPDPRFDSADNAVDKDARRDATTKRNKRNG